MSSGLAEIEYRTVCRKTQEQSMVFSEVPEGSRKIRQELKRILKV